MAARDQALWDARYGQLAAGPYPMPDPLLLQYAPPPALLERQPAYALDLACGLGQNGLWLARQGYTVDLMDISRAALLRAQQEAGAYGVRSVNFMLRDLDEVALTPNYYDLVCVFRYFNPALLPRLRACVRPGGRVVYQTFNRLAAGQSPALLPDHLVEPGELEGYFGDWRLLFHTSSGIHAAVVAVKPAAAPR
jgi:SAM-dependent methyltransferase